MSARKARAIRRRCQRHGQYPDGLGVSELFLAPPQDAEVILAANDPRLKRYLLGLSEGSAASRIGTPASE